jgi:hypothetical protein
MTAYQMHYNNPVMQDYFAEKTKEIVVTIFNEKTIAENREFTNNQQRYKAIYSAPVPISPTIPITKGLFVLEANNDLNMIEGIGYIKQTDDRHCKFIYDDPKYNQYTYYGTHHIDRASMTPDELVIMDVLDTLCFNGKTHLKRFRGIRRFPKKWIYRIWLNSQLDLIAMISAMFKARQDALIKT